MHKRFPWFEIVLILVFMTAFIYAAFSDAYNLPYRWFIRDDAYYYFKVAQNISEGRGSTFDGIHPTNGYHPLWMLVCVPVFALARFDLILPLRVLVLLTGVLQLGTALLLYRLVRGVISQPAAVLAAVYWVTDSYILVFLYKTGVESSLALFLIVLLLYLTWRTECTWRQAEPRLGRIAVLAAITALIVFSRLDLVFFAFIMGIWVVLRQSALRYLLPLDLLAFFVSALAAFLLRLGFAVYYETSTAALALAAVTAAVEVPLFFGLGLYRRPAAWTGIGLLARTVIGVLGGGAVSAGLLLAATALGWLPTVSRVVLGIQAVLTLVLILLIRLVVYLFHPTMDRENGPSPLEELQEHWRGWLREGSVFYGIVGGSLGLYMLWNKLAFGSASPVSGEVKRWWGTFLISVYGGPAKTWLSFFGADPYGEFDAWQPTTTLLRDWSNRFIFRNSTKFGNAAWQQDYVIILGAALLLLLLALLVTRRKSTRAVVQAGMIPLFVGGWLQPLSYNATGYASPKEWYWLTQPLLQALVAALLVNIVYDRVLKRWRPTRILAWGVVAAFAVWSTAGYWRDTLALNPYGQAAANAPFADVIPFLERHTPPGSIIGMTGGGNVGYFMQGRTIVNMDGLINSPEYFQDLRAGTSPEYLYASGMRYVFANPDLLKANPYRGQFDGRLKPIESWGGKDLMRLLPVGPE